MPVRLHLTTIAFTALASACDAFPQRARTTFNADSAIAYAQTQVNFGPRVPGTDAARKAGDWIVNEMKKRADTVIVQAWTHVTARHDTLPMRNIFAQFRPQATERVLYVTHWDTRPRADEDPNLGRRQQSFDGANDGASGVGLFVALADVLRKTPPSVGVDLLFVDGEDWGDFNEYPRVPDVLIGSTYFGAHPAIAGYHPLYGVVWDMIGDKDLNIYQENNSINAAPEVVTRVWQTAKDLGYQNHFLWQDGGAITDDHVPLISVGHFRVIDVLDINYYGPDGTNYHHTSMDTMDKISRESLQAVGDVALTLVR